MKKLLVVIDMQNDFIDGSLGTKEAVAIVPNVIKKIQEYKDNEDVVAYTLDTHYKNYMYTLEGKNLPVPHCIAGTKGHRVCKEIEEVGDFYYQPIYAGSDDILIDGPIRFEKNTFGSVDLADEIHDAVIDGDCEYVELVGLCTDICVISNALLIKASCPEIDIVVDASCCAGVTPESHKNALAAMKMCQIRVINEEN